MDTGRKWAASVETPLGGAGVDVGLSFGASAAASDDVTDAGKVKVDHGDESSPADTDDGYRVEERTESKRFAQSEEVRELDDHRTEIRHKDETEFRLDEVKVRESDPRPITLEEMKALLNAEFDGTAGGDVELEISRDVTVEEFTAVERQHTTVDPITGEKKTEVTTSESHSIQETSAKPQQDQVSPEKLLAAAEVDNETMIPVVIQVNEATPAAASLSANISADVEVPNVQVAAEAVPTAKISTDLYSFLTAPSQQSDDQGGIGASASVNISTDKVKGGGGIFGKLKANKKPRSAAVKGGIPVEGQASDTGTVEQDDVSSSSSLEHKKVKPEAGLGVEASGNVTLESVGPTLGGGTRKHHEIKHKKHVIEEVVLEDTDTFYEEFNRKKPKLLLGAKRKAGKENVTPEAELRRRSTGELPSPAVAVPTGPRAVSTTNVASEQQVTFVVNYDLPASTPKKPKSSKDRWSWTLPTFKGSGKGTDSPASSETSATKEKKPKIVHGRQEEVVVEDTGLFTDSSMDRKRWGFHLKKPQLPTVPAEHAEANDDDLPKTETVTFIVQPDPASSYIKVEPRVEDPEVTIASNDGDGIKGKAEARGNVELPKFKLFDRKFGKATSGDDVRVETVTYVVEPMDIQGPDVEASAKGGGHGGIEFPKLKLPDIHLKSKKSPGKDATDGAETTETVTFVVEQPSISAEGESGAEINVKGGGHKGIELPKIKLPDIHFGSKGSSNKEDDGDRKTETVTFVVESSGNVSGPSADVNVSAEADAKSSGKKWLPEFHFGHKGNVDKPAVTTESVTYVVEPPAGNVDADGGAAASVEGKTGHRGGFDLPKLKFSSGDAKGNASASTTETVTYVVQQPTDVNADGNGAPDASGKFGARGGIGIELPKLHLFDKKSESPDEDHESKKSGKKWLPDIHLGVHHHKEVNVDTGETVTYIVEQPELVSSASVDDDRSGQAEVQVKADGEADKSGTTVTYVVKHSATVPASDDKHRFGLELPKVSLNLHGKGDAKVDKGKKDKRKDKKQKEEVVDESRSIEVEETRRGKWGIHFGKKSSVSSSDSSEKQTTDKPSGGIKWKPPKIHFRTSGSYDVSAPAASGTVKAKQPEATAAAGASIKFGLKDEVEPSAQEVNVIGDLQIPDLSLGNMLSGMATVDVNAPEATASMHLDVDADEVKAVKVVELHHEPPTATASVSGVVNGYPEISRREGSASVDHREEFVFTGGLDNDDRIRVTTSAALLTSTPKKETSAKTSGSSLPSRSSADRQRPRSLIVDGETGYGKGDVGSSNLSKSSSTGRLAPWLTPHFVIVAIDFGTTFSGYAFCFPGDVTAAREKGEALPAIHVMRKWEDGDPGAVDMKTPTTLLLTPEREFHSFGFTARNFYHDLSPTEAKRWLYFEKFKMTLHYCSELNSETELQAANGEKVKAFVVFSLALRFFRDHALQELSDQSQTKILNEDIRWIITVPAIWKEPAKQFMRQAAYEAGIASADNPSQLLIALEPEAASVFVRRQRLNLLLNKEEEEALTARRAPSPEPVVIEHSLSSSHTDVNSTQLSQTLQTSFQYHRAASPIVSPISPDIDMAGTKYMIVDCGGGTVDITVYQMITESGKLKELYQATGGPYGSIGIDKDFELLLVDIFGADFIEAFKRKRPAGWVDLLLAFESRKRAATPFKSKALNVSLPFSFTDYHKKYRNCGVDSAIRRYNNKDVTWSQQGMLRLTPDAMHRLFEPTIEKIKQQIANVLNEPAVRGLRYIFLVGGFAESPMLQLEVRNEFAGIAKILIPNDASLTILKGAVCYGLHPGIVASRKSRMTYGVAVVNRFQRGRDPESKLRVRDGIEWCVDVFDVLVRAGDSVGLNDPVVRSYAPVAPGQRTSIFTVYATESPDVRFITDPGVRKCGTLRLELSSPAEGEEQDSQLPREIRAKMTFGDTETKVTAVEVATGKSVNAQFDFLSSSV